MVERLNLPFMSQHTCSLREFLFCFVPQNKISVLFFQCHEKGTEKRRSLLVKGEFSFPVDGYFVIGKEVPRWLQRLDFHSCTDEADKRR